MFIANNKSFSLFGRDTVSSNWLGIESDVVSFRTKCYNDDGVCGGRVSSYLINDYWDDDAMHIVVYGVSNISGSVRICLQKSGRLPLSIGYPEFQIQKGDIEISRLIVQSECRKGFVFLKLVSGIFKFIQINEDSRILIDVCEGRYSNIKRSSYERLGFVDTGLNYWDARYNAKSSLMLGTIEGLIYSHKSLEKVFMRASNIKFY